MAPINGEVYLQYQPVQEHWFTPGTSDSEAPDPAPQRRIRGLAVARTRREPILAVAISEVVPEHRREELAYFTSSATTVPSATPTISFPFSQAMSLTSLASI